MVQKFYGSYYFVQIVERLPAEASEDEAIAYAKSRLKKGFWETMPEEDRCAFICEVKRVFKRVHART